MALGRESYEGEDWDCPSLFIPSRESSTPFPQHVGGAAVDAYIEDRFAKLRARRQSHVGQQAAEASPDLTVLADSDASLSSIEIRRQILEKEPIRLSWLGRVMRRITGSPI